MLGRQPAGPWGKLLSGRTAQEFLDNDLFGCLAPRDVIVGPDFTFGKARGGTVELLRQACEARWPAGTQEAAGTGAHQAPKAALQGAS